MIIRIPWNSTAAYLSIVLCVVLLSGCDDNRDMSSAAYHNPVWEGYLADPAVMKSNNGAWYAYGTGTDDSGKLHFPVLKSEDFFDWELVGYALNPDAQGLEFDQYWAPEAVEHDGKYYLYFAGNCKMRVAIADKPQGPYVDAGLELFPELPFSIDGHPYRDPDTGEWYLFFAEDFLDTERVGTGLSVVRLGEDMISVKGPVKSVLTAFADWQIFERDRKMYGKIYDWHTIEGAWVVKRDGQYYCFYAASNYQTPNYGVGFAIADHPMGPWSDGGNLEEAKVLSGKGNNLIGPGHNSVAEKAFGETDFIVYHSWNEERTKRMMCIDPIEWTSDGPRAVNPSFGDKTVTKE